LLRAQTEASGSPAHQHLSGRGAECPDQIVALHESTARFQCLATVMLCPDRLPDTEDDLADMFSAIENLLCFIRLREGEDAVDVGADGTAFKFRPEVLDQLLSPGDCAAARSYGFKNIVGGAGKGIAPCRRGRAAGVSPRRH